MYLASFKWHLLIPDFKFLSLYKSNIISFYYSIFLPGQLASEGVKLFRLIDKNHSTIDISCSLFVDKALGIIGLLLLGSIGGFFSSFHNKLKLVIFSLLIISCIFILIIYNLKLTVKLLHFVIKFLFNLLSKQIKSLSKWAHESDKKILEVENTFEKFFVNKVTILKVLCFALFSQAINILGQFFLAKSLNIELSFFDWAWIFALMSLMLLLPISFAGIGVRESGLVGIFAYLGLRAEPAIAFSLATYILLIIYALIGYIVDLLWGVE